MVSLQMIYYIPITYDTYKTYYVLWSHYIIKIIVRLQNTSNELQYVLQCHYKCEYINEIT